MQHGLIIDEIDDIQPDTVLVLGIPFDQYSSYRRGPAFAPPRIRQALHGGSANLCAESGWDLGADPNWRDLGDLVLPDGDAALGVIEESVGRLLERGAKLLSLGGDHIVTYPILRAYARAYPELTVLHLDAHPDLYDQLHNNRFSHACPFARIMEEKLVTRLVQVGIRTMNPHQREQADRFGVELIEAWAWSRRPALDLQGPLYVSLDLDVLDPAFAPGVSHHEPGGLSTRDLLEFIKNLPANVVGADIVEYNPERDHCEMTAMVAAKLAKEIIARMLDR